MSRALTKKEELRESIIKYKLMGLTNKDIGQVLQVSTEVVSYHLKYFKSGLINLAYKRDLRELAGESISIFDLVAKEAWKSIEDCEKPSLRAKFLDVIIQAQEKKYELLKELGFIDYSAGSEEQNLDNQTQQAVRELNENPETRKFLERKLTERLANEVLSEPEPLADYDKDVKIDVLTDTPIDDETSN